VTSRARAWRWAEGPALVLPALLLVLGVLASLLGGGYAARLGEEQAQDVLDRRAALAAWALQGEVARYRDTVGTLAASVGAQ